MSARITDVEIVPIAFPDPPLLNVAGVHEPLALRTVVLVHTDAGIVGLGEGWGGARVLERLERVRSAVVGVDVLATADLERAVDQVLGNGPGTPTAMERRIVTAPLEVACLDVAGRLLDVPVSTLLGGAVRDRVDFAGYLFYKWAGHPGAPDDVWGEALDPDGIVRQARRMVETWGFGSLKLKGGSLPPAVEADTVLALAEALPDHALRIDPNGAWTLPTARAVADRVGDALEYLEDPVLGKEQMAELAREVDLPLATNMCVVEPDDLAPAVALGSVSIVLADHHYWGGLRRTRELAAVCDAFDLGLSMHSNSHLGISLAAMVHVAAASPRLSHACDTHYPWNHASEVVVPGSLVWENGAVLVPQGPGLGVELDRDRLDVLHRQFLDSGRAERDDASYLRRFQPDFDTAMPRF